MYYFKLSLYFFKIHYNQIRNQFYSNLFRFIVIVIIFDYSGSNIKFQIEFICEFAIYFYVQSNSKLNVFEILFIGIQSEFAIFIKVNYL